MRRAGVGIGRSVRGTVLEGNLPSQTCDVDQLGLVEGSSHSPFSSCGLCRRGGGLGRLGLRLARGQRQRTWVQGRPRPESIVGSDLCGLRRVRRVALFNRLRIVHHQNKRDVVVVTCLPSAFFVVQPRKAKKGRLG